MASAVYRFEQAKSGRAKCRVAGCDVINKGELRMGTLVTIKENTTWHWKHWQVIRLITTVIANHTRGCVSPHQIGNLKSQIEGLDPDDDEDMQVIDGFEEVNEDSREKIREALKVGHVADEDWKGDIELNRPGQKGIRKRTPKKKKAASEEPEEEESPETETPVKKGKAKNDVDDKPAKSSKKRQAEEDPDTKPKKSKKAKKEESDDELAPPPAKKSKKAKMEDVDDEPAPVKKSSRAKKATLTDGADEEEEEPAPKAKKSKKSKVKAEEEEDMVEVQDAAPVPAKKGRKVKKEETEEEAAPVRKGRGRKTRA